MKVDVKLYASLRKYAPEGNETGKSFEVELTDPTIAGLLEQLGIDEDLAKIIMVNGIRVKDKNQSIKEGDLVVVFPPVGGG